MAMTGTNAAIKQFINTTNAVITTPVQLRKITFTCYGAATATLYDGASSAPIINFSAAGADMQEIDFGECGYQLPAGIKLVNATATARITLYT